MGKSLVSILEGGGGRVPRLDTVELLAVALSLSPSFLAFGIELPFEPATELRTMGFAARLSEARRERGLSMRAVDSLAGISPGSTRSLEAGTMPSLDTLELIAKALGVSPAWLAFGEGPRELPRRGKQATAQPPKKQKPTQSPGSASRLATEAARGE